MMGQSTLADIFGEEFDFFASAPKKEEAKKPEKKKETKKEGSKSSSKKAAEKVLHVTLPCKVYGDAFVKEIQPREGESEVIDNTELSKRLIEAGIDEAASSARGIFIPEDNAAVAYLVQKHEIAVGDDTVLVFGESGVTYAYGEKKATFTLADFEGKEEDEVTLSDVKEKIFELSPAVKGKELYYDVEAGVITPGFAFVKAENDNTKLSYPLTVNANGTERTLDGTEFEGDTTKDLISFLTKGYEVKGLDVRLAKLSDGIFYTILKANTSLAGKVEKKNAGKSAKKKEEKYPVEGTTCYLVFNGYKELLTKEAFGGKEKIVKQDLIEYFKPKFAVFASAEKVSGVNCVYDTTSKVLSVDITPGRRGAFGATPSPGVVSTPEQLKGLLFNPAESCFNAQIGGMCGEHAGELLFANQTAAYFLSPDEQKLLYFIQKCGAVPHGIKAGILSYFKNKLPMEAIVRILFNAYDGQFSLQYPKSAVETKVSVGNAVFEPIKNPYIGIAATFHSHNTMPAFFSSVDDAAEMDQIGVFGVIGRLDEDEPDILIRAMYQGSSLMLDPATYFERTGEAAA